MHHLQFNGLLCFGDTASLKHIYEVFIHYKLYFCVTFDKNKTKNNAVFNTFIVKDNINFIELDQSKLFEYLHYCQLI